MGLRSWSRECESEACVSRTGPLRRNESRRFPVQFRHAVVHGLGAFDGHDASLKEALSSFSILMVEILKDNARPESGPDLGSIEWIGVANGQSLTSAEGRVTTTELPGMHPSNIMPTAASNYESPEFFHNS